MGDRGFEDEWRYQVAMGLARGLLRDGTITERAYKDFDERMREKYAPTFSRLFTDISLEKRLI